MGCAPSGDSAMFRQTNNNFTQRNDETMAQAFIRLEETIHQLESEAPAAKLAVILPKLQVLQQELITEEEQYSRYGAEMDRDEPLLQVVDDLQLVNNPQKAAEHEEFVANINRRIIMKLSHECMEVCFKDQNDLKKKLEADVKNLQDLYMEQDALLEIVLGNQYGSVDERNLEAELGRVRALRDTLAGGAFGWKTAITHSLKAHNSAKQALTSWLKIPQCRSLKDIVQMGTETRKHLCFAKAEIQVIRSALPSTALPHCTPRQLQALSLTMDYMFTDMHSEDRYKHATRIFTGFSERTLSLSKWITDVLKTTLESDLNEVDEKVKTLSNKLRAVRINLMAHKGLTDVYYKGAKQNGSVNK